MARLGGTVHGRTTTGAAEESAALRAAGDGLPEDHATVIRLVHPEGLTLVDASSSGEGP